MTRRAMAVGTEGEREALLARAEVLGRRSGANLPCRFRPGSWRHLRVAWDSRRDRVGLRSLEQRGFALLEVLIAGIVVGITILGVSLMLVRAPAFTVSEGTNQVELYLAEQKLERLRAVGLLGVDVGGPPTDPCSSDVDTCYYETLQGGAVTNGQPQSFKRLTCVDYVRDLPYPAVCTPNACDASVQTPDPDGTTPAGTTGCRTKRVQVKVQPLNQSEFAKADDPIALDMILVNPPQAVR